jgi:hypothetical protein
MKKAIFFSALLFWGACNKSKNTQENPTPEVVLTAVNTVTDKQNNVYTVGYDQVTSVNQDAYVQKKNANGQVVWRLNYENTTPDSRGVWIALDENDTPWVIFSIDGGSGDTGYITRKEIEGAPFSGSFLSGYGKGGGAKVAVLARLNPTTGKMVKATFLVSRTNEGNHNAVDKTNSLEVTKFGVADGKVVLEANAWFKPFSNQATEGNYKFHPEATDSNKHGAYWKLRVTLPTSLSKIDESFIVKP